MVITGLMMGVTGWCRAAAALRRASIMFAATHLDKLLPILQQAQQLSDKRVKVAC